MVVVADLVVEEGATVVVACTEEVCVDSVCSSVVDTIVVPSEILFGIGIFFVSYLILQFPWTFVLYLSCFLL